MLKKKENIRGRDIPMVLYFDNYSSTISQRKPSYVWIISSNTNLMH